MADGSLSLEVTDIKETSVMCTVLNNATFGIDRELFISSDWPCLGERKNMNLPGAVVDLPTLTDKDVGKLLAIWLFWISFDLDDLKNFGVKHGVDFIAASFVRKGKDIDFIREVLGTEGANIKVH